MQEHCRLSYFSLAEIFVCAVKHYVCNLVTKNRICFIKQRLCLRIVFIEFFTHSYELCALARKNISFHISKYLQNKSILRAKVAFLFETLFFGFEKMINRPMPCAQLNVSTGLQSLEQIRLSQSNRLGELVPAGIISRYRR